MEIIKVITEKILPFSSSVTALIISNLNFSVQARLSFICRTAADKLRFLFSDSQYLRAFNYGFLLFFWLFLLRMRGRLLIYQKCPFLVFFGATDGNFMEKYSVTPSWQSICLWKLTGVRKFVDQPTSACFKWHTSNNSVSSKDFGLLKFPWKTVQHSESGWYADDLIFVHPPWVPNCMKNLKGVENFHFPRCLILTETCS